MKQFANIVITATVATVVSMVTFASIDGVKLALEVHRVGKCHPKPVDMTNREYGAFLAGKLGEDRFDVRSCNANGTYVVARAL